MWPVWVLGDEDKSRAATKFGHFTLGLQALQILLPGSPSIYYGDEIKATNHSSITYEETIDSVGKDAGPQYYQTVSRDPCRTPMRWNSSKHAGNSFFWYFHKDDYLFKSQDLARRRRHGYRRTAEILLSATCAWDLKRFWTPSKNCWTLGSPPSPWWTERSIIRSWIIVTLHLPGKKLSCFDIATENEMQFRFRRTHLTNNTGYLVAWNLGDSSKTISFQNITYMSQDLQLIRTIEPDRSYG